MPPDQTPAELGDRLDQLALQPHLLVVSDYDGTLSPIVADPDRALPIRESIVALRTLAAQPETHVAVVSGRALEDLARLTGLPESVHLVGSHGSEFDVGFVDTLSPERQELLAEVGRRLAEIAGDTPGFTLETKPASVAFHYRNADPAEAERAVHEITAGPAELEGVHTKRGKMVVELGVVGLNKGDALQRLRQRVGASAVLFFGDDVTDEDAFETLRGPDVGVKVGDGETAAGFRVDTPLDVARLLARLAERRATWLGGGEAVPIEHHAMLSDLRTIALVTPRARVSWMCVPRIDSSSLFAELIGGASAGYFAIEPADGAEPVGQRYDGDSLNLVTEFPTFTVTDYLDCTGGRIGQRAGRTDLVRIVRGTGRVRIEFAPRQDFSRAPSLLEVREGGIQLLDTPDPIVLFAPGVEWEVRRDGPHHTAVAEVQLTGEPLVVSLRGGATTLRPSTLEPIDRERQTKAFWEEWASRLTPPALAREHVVRSALTLKALSYGPTGAIAAAGTTSLPETFGGVRNWDYRYCWPRDAAIAATALLKLGALDEAVDLLDWLLGVFERALTPDRINPLYTVTGAEIPIEGEIGDLPGYGGSRPVRVGNAAARQVQLDVFGPIAELLYELARRDASITPQHWFVAESVVAAVRSRWDDADHGIWEIRGRPRRHVHSKVMCWLTVDRAIKSSRLLRDDVHPEWETLRQRIAEDVLERGWNERVGAFTGAYELDEVDAASLWIGLSGLLDPSDERFHRTIAAVERDLLRDGAVYRYKYDDGLPGFEGAFHLCTCWLILSYHIVGRADDARALFDRYLSFTGPTGLLSEEYGVNSGRALGNHPQAYSHAGLIECALALDAG
jgi:trehalose 6-phosphate phosphatase